MNRLYEPQNKPIRHEPNEARKKYSYNQPEDGQLFYKYQQPKLHSLFSLSEKYFWFSLKEKLNDPHEMRVKCQETESDQEIVNWAIKLAELGEEHLIGGHDNLENIVNDVDGSIEKYRSYWFRSLNTNMDLRHSSNKYFCVTEKYDSPAMWSHYTDDYTGWVIGFDPHTIFDGVPSNVWFKVNYEKNIPVFTLKDLFENMEYQHLLFATKYSEWAYEEEWRCLNSFDNHDIGINIDAVKNITFGMGCKEQTKRLIVRLTDGWDIEYYNSIPSEESYKIIRTTYE